MSKVSEMKTREELREESKENIVFWVVCIGIIIAFAGVIALQVSLLSEQEQAQREERQAHAAMVREYQDTFTLFVDSLNNNGVLPFEAWQLSDSLELSEYGIALLSSFLRENAPDATLRQMLEFIESGAIDITEYI